MSGPSVGLVGPTPEPRRTQSREDVLTDFTGFDRCEEEDFEEIVTTPIAEAEEESRCAMPAGSPLADQRAQPHGGELKHQSLSTIASVSSLES